jgi:inosine-uridine nucleoside N-ribohydrolase
VIGYLLAPELFTLADAEIEVETSGISAGRSLMWRTSRFSDRVANARFATGVDARAFLRMFLAHVAPGFTQEIDAVLANEYLPRIYQSS